MNNSVYTMAAKDGGVYRWHIVVRWRILSSREGFASLEDAVRAAQSVACSGGHDFRHDGNGEFVSNAELVRWRQTPYWQEPFDRKRLRAWEMEEESESEEREWQTKVWQW